ncbi:hypothetical protein H310_02805 [Aphanomyces invadans]|uniref:Uncharacterized protein n=1 Tax=Aphanomyces invadans TaxID=157072 RepID=A0A024UL50_9STRA|nr:hypothetical protein H310_02805 [Aphanomyces invadans]ETW06587.1 hypothetical protein H310_02805 [Aphanomyces invadans]|eukprot:XP_008864662.1 hypothetical protein H310_02805 [Aphanomyces invadans]
MSTYPMGHLYVVQVMEYMDEDVGLFYQRELLKFELIRPMTLLADDLMKKDLRGNPTNCDNRVRTTHDGLCLAQRRNSVEVLIDERSFLGDSGSAAFNTKADGRKQLAQALERLFDVLVNATK